MHCPARKQQVQADYCTCRQSCDCTFVYILEHTLQKRSTGRPPSGMHGSNRKQRLCLSLDLHAHLGVQINSGSMHLCKPR
jgi:hypothetical protein